MIRARLLLLGLALAAALGLPASASAAAPAWSIQSLAVPTNFKPAPSSEKTRYQVFFSNSGGANTDGSEITITDTLPAGVGVKDIELFPPRNSNTDLNEKGKACGEATVAEVTTVTCKVDNSLLPGPDPAKLYPGNALLLQIELTLSPAAAGTLTNRVEVEGGNAPPASAESQNPVSGEDAGAGFEEFHADLTDANGLPATAADSHPYQYATSFGVNVVPGPPGGSAEFIPAGGSLKEIEVALPPGLAGNPTAVERCSAQEFNNTRFVPSLLEGDLRPNACPLGSIVGLAAVEQLEGFATTIYKAPIFNLFPPKGMPAQLGFQVLGAPLYIDTKVRSDSDFGISAVLHNVTEAQRVTAARIMIWGTPWDGSHDTMRGLCAMRGEGECEVAGTAKPFLRTPSSCENQLTTTMAFSSWALPPASAFASDSEAAPTDCAEPDFSPTIAAKPTTNTADSPSGLRFDLHLPQKEHEAPLGLGEADLKDVSVKLAPGLIVNPASADGLGACTPTQVGLTSAPGQSPPRFDAAPAQCPQAAKIGSVVANVPALDHPVSGGVFLAAQEDNPFKSLLAIYIVLEDPESGIVVKLAGEVSPDPLTGQLTTTVKGSPQLPIEDVNLAFFEGSRAPLRTPASCATYTTTATLTPWTAPAGPTATRTDSFEIGSGPSGSCPTGALAPKLDAGLAKPDAGTYSPFSLRVSRADGSGEFSAISASPPSGLTAKLAGIPYCTETDIAQAASRGGPGKGALERASSSCPSSSQVGTTTAAAGAGPTPFYTGGKVFLAGPYKGAPISFVAIVPAVAGPFDLGAIVNRIAVKIDPESAQVTAVSDPLPRILSGIVLDVRDIVVDLNRPNFTLAPTSCEPKTVAATVTGTSGGSATVSQRFQLGGCAALRFKPSMTLTLSGGTRRGAHPALKTVVSYPPGSGYANTAKASAALPHSEFLDQAHIRTICTRVQFAADACPKASIYGKARATTPLLDKPLEGPVYLRSSSHPLPDLVAALHGQLDVVVAGRVDSVNGGVRASFEAVPDAPITKFVLEMQGGKKGLLVNSRNICKHTNRVSAKFTGQNGKTAEFRPVLKAKNCKGKPKSGKGKKPGKKGKGGKR